MIGFIKILILSRDSAQQQTLSNRKAHSSFATKNDDLNFIKTQFNAFKEMVNWVKEPNLIIHCANSYVSLTDKSKLCNMVRVGFSLYSNYYGNLNLENVVSIKAKILAIKQHQHETLCLFKLTISYQ